MRKVLLDELPRWKKGEGAGNPGKINWVKCVGYKVKFIYDDIQGEIEIIGYNKETRKLNVKYNNNNTSISTDGFFKCKLGGLLIRYESPKTDSFEIYNVLKVNEKGIMWNEIENNEILKTYHEKYGYNEFKFIEYNKKIRKLCLEYKNDISYISTDSFVTGKIGKLINIHTVNFKISIGEKFIDEKRDLIITDREYRKEKHGKSLVNGKWYKYTCNICGWTEGWADESHLLNDRGCSCCAGKVVVNGINDIATTAPWMLDIGVSLKDALIYTQISGKRITVKCPNCDTNKNIKISDISRNKTIGCRVCGDSVSYPEKIVNNIFNQINIHFETQKVLFKNKGNKIRYDFYFVYNGKRYIVETHGMQHYEYGFDRYGGRTVEEEQANDRYKKEMAIKNGIDVYIVVDCRYSELEWIKNSMLNSELNDLFDLTEIDWLECEKFALKNIVKEVCEYWNNKEEWETTQTIADNNPWGIRGNGAIRSYLKKGVKLGWCDYNPEEEKSRVSVRNGMKMKERNSVPVCVFKEDILLHTFDSLTEAEKQSKDLLGVQLSRNCITNVIKGRQKQHRGFTFKLLEDID